jgi:LacI family transcriptional regulator
MPTPVPSRPTLLQVARAAGVALSTASMALRGHPRISAATRRRVAAAAETLDYRPDPELQRLMAHLQKSHRGAITAEIAYLGPEARSDKSAQPVFAAMCQGAMQQAAKMGYRLHLMRLAPEDPADARRVQRVLTARGIRGVIVGPYAQPHRVLPLRWDDLAVVNLGYSVDSPDTHRVNNDNRDTMRLVLRAVHAAGYRRIGLALGARRDERARHAWSDAFYGFQQRVLPRRDHVPIGPDDESAALAAWFTRHKPEVVIALNRALPDKLRPHGKIVGRDYAFATLDWSGEAAPLDVAGAHQQHDTLGATAVEVVARNARSQRIRPPVPAPHGPHHRALARRSLPPAPRTRRPARPGASLDPILFI